MLEPVAIVGMGCRFPDAEDPAALWNNVLRRRRSFVTLDQQRWDHRLFYSESAREKNRSTCKRAALIRGVDRFAARHFELSPRRARVMDPQQRLLLETSREALQDAGYECSSFERQQSAVFFGLSVCEYAGLMALPARVRQIASGRFVKSGAPLEGDGLQAFQAYTMPGSLLSMSAANVAQFFGLGGPALTVDAACASSLAAVVLGCRHLQGQQQGSHGAPLALAGGAYLLLHPDNLIAFSKTGALAKFDCRPFDRQSEGFLIGEGVGTVVLKKLDHALADGDRIYAVIRAAEWNNDGASGSPVLPSKEGQTRLLRQVLERADFEAASIDYVECHGTGTAQGDQVELQALGGVLGLDPEKPPAGMGPVRLGTAKGNFGHTLSAAGIAGLQRAALAVFHQLYPPQAGWDSWAEPLQHWDGSFRIDTEPSSWTGRRRALVNAFGFGGSNCSLALESAPSAPLPGEPGGGPETFEFVASASEAGLLEAYLGKLEQAFRSGQSLASIAAALSLRPRLGYSAAWSAGDRGSGLLELRRLRQQLGVDAPTEWQELGVYCGLGPDPSPRPAAETSSTPKANPDRAVLPPSPLPRRSLWCTAVIPQPSVLSEACPTLPEVLGDELELLTAHHRFLRAHTVDQRCLFPLAVALDLLCWYAKLRPPFALQQIEVGRPWLLGERAQIAFGREESRLHVSQRRPTGRLVPAFSAVPTTLGQQPSGSLWQTRGDSLSPGLADFYQRQQLHQSDFQALLNLDEHGGEVLTSRPAWTYAGDPRDRWHLDPLMIDGAFQLALFHAGEVLWPVSIGELALLEIPRGSSVRVQQTLDPEIELLAHYQIFDKNRLIGWMTDVQARRG